MTRRRGVLVLLLTASLLLATPLPAAAVVWQPAPCATGEITLHRMDLSGRYPDLDLGGWIRPCPGTGQTNGFAIMYHTPDMNYVMGLEPYESLDAPTDFYLRLLYIPFLVERWNETGGLRGLCLVRSYEHRLSCVSIEPDADGTPSVLPVPPDDPDLVAPVSMTGPPRGWFDPVIDPNCGTCA